MAENKMKQVESLLIWLASGIKDEDGNWLGDNDTQLVCDALEYYLNMHRQQNKMEQVATMFGKKLDEQFRLVMPSGKIKECKFTADKGLLYYDRIGREWRKNYAHLDWLSRGKAVIVDE